MVLNNKYEVLAMYPDFESDFKELVSNENMEYFGIFTSSDEAKIALEDCLDITSSNTRRQLTPILPNGDIVSSPIDFIFEEKSIGGVTSEALILYAFPKHQLGDQKVVKGIDETDSFDRVPEFTYLDDKSVSEIEILPAGYAICSIDTDSFEITENDNFSFGEYTDPYANLLK